MKRYTLNTDGGARGNPGPAAISAVIKEDNNIIFEVGKYIGKTTNNEAEYRALVEGVRSSIEKGIKNLDCYLDSELIVKQLNGLYKVKNENLKVFFLEIKGLEKHFDSITYTHVYRENNKRADELVNQVLDNTNI